MDEKRGFFSLVTGTLLFIITALSTHGTVSSRVDPATLSWLRLHEGVYSRCMHSYGLKCYRFHETKQMWRTAQQQVLSQEDESLAFSLAVPNSSGERDWLSDLIMFFGQDVWIGLRRDQGTWRRMNGQPYVMNSSDWVPGSPGTGLGEACAHASPCTKGKWKEASCSLKKSFFSTNSGINGGWGSWAGWSTCSKTCGTGTQYRTRSCDKPRQREPGEPCRGHSNEKRFCKSYRCPIEWATCDVSGDPNYFTFDGARFDFQGGNHQGRECPFLLAGRCSDDSPLPPFQILSLNIHIGSPSVSWVNAIELKFHDHVIRVDMSFLITGAIYVDNVRVNADNYRGVKGVTVTKLRDQVRLSIEDGLVYVSLDSQRKVVIGIDKCLVGTKGLCGLCGNYDGHRLNDLNLRDGTKIDTWNDLGWSYLEPNDDGRNCKKHFIPPCDVTDCARGKRCDPLKQPEVFGKCVEHYNAHNACVTDLCCTTASVDMCQFFKGYADKCARIGHPVPPDWQVKVKCDQPKCPANSKYHHTAGACQETCTGLIDGCRDVAKKGECVCNPGHVWYRNACIRKEHCGCVSESGEIHPLASTWRDLCCTKAYYCHKNPNGKPVIKTVSMKCHSAAQCRLIDGKFECQCASGFKRHGHTCVGFTCPSNKTMLYKDPAGCKGYFICLNGKSIKGTCGYLLKFDDKTKGCIMMEDCPEQDTCATVKGKPARARRMVKDDIEGWVGDGKFTCPRPDDAFPNPGTCKQFYSCVNGNAFEGECAEGSNFDPERAKCVMTKVKGC